ncbi:hypothetical protein [Poseidonibacter lekithochrous]|uniref:hypothetical protein n=1 Tax=Poseidonibacter lekithochrous TaxID=1904463 RepID=UPI000D39DC48|nr:hypothetical protein [Poseidonibacter lekithochrous]
MQITSNTKSTSIYTSNTQKEANKTFDKDLKNASENDINEVENNNNGKFIRYLEHHNSFKYINPDDLSFFKEILWDNKITDEEYKSIPYEKLDSFNKFITLPKGFNTKDIPIFLSEKSFHLNTAYSYSKDLDFNKALYNTYKDLSLEDISTLFFELNANVEQTKKGEAVSILYFTDIYTEKPKSDNLEYQVDFTKLLTSIIDQSQEHLNSPITHPEIKKQLEKTKDLYSTLFDNYKQVKTETRLDDEKQEANKINSNSLQYNRFHI